MRAQSFFAIGNAITPSGLDVMRQLVRSFNDAVESLPELPKVQLRKDCSACFHDSDARSCRVTQIERPQSAQRSHHPLPRSLLIECKGRSLRKRKPRRNDLHRSHNAADVTLR